MSDKTRLEYEIEREEMKRRLSGTRLLVAFLIIMLLGSGVYIYKLRDEIRQKDEEIMMIKEKNKKEMSELLKRFKEGSLSPSSIPHSYHPSSP